MQKIRCCINALLVFAMVMSGCATAVGTVAGPAVSSIACPIQGEKRAQEVALECSSPSRPHYTSNDVWCPENDIAKEDIGSREKISTPQKLLGYIILSPYIAIVGAAGAVTLFGMSAGSGAYHGLDADSKLILGEISLKQYLAEDLPKASNLCAKR